MIGDTVLLPDLKGGSDSVQFRHHDIQDQKVYILLFKDTERLYAVISFQDMISLLRQIDLSIASTISLSSSHTRILYIFITSLTVYMISKFF